MGQTVSEIWALEVISAILRTKEIFKSVILNSESKTDDKLYNNNNNRNFQILFELGCQTF